MANLEDDAKNFWLGMVVKVHTLGPYSLLEYVQKEFNPPSKTAGHTFFAGYIEGKSVSQSWESLEKGIIGLIVHNNIGHNQDAAASFIYRGLGI